MTKIKKIIDIFYTRYSYLGLYSLHARLLVRLSTAIPGVILLS